ncbi:MAG: AAA family ATPase [Desulfobacula sp.]
MYNGFFGFRETPFKLVPNPEFLFLGRTHEEALAHLTYAVSQGDGFVEITGEVGTGKTTLCRVFLENLDKDIEAAFIFNPKLDSIQLLKAIHIELSIPFTGEDPVSLTNSLNEFLLEKKALGKSVLILIDEAQNLGRETLEQLRLLSNLETTRSKLLQIILVGQPELCDILDSYEMRQLRQRINLSCHILPLTRKETHAYISHRVNVAMRKPETLFTSKAMDLIYAHSGGIPRLINIACDRALLAAYSLNRKKVTPHIIKIAIRELDTRKAARTGYGLFIGKTIGAVFALILIAVLVLAVIKGIPPGWIPGNDPADQIALKPGIPETPTEPASLDIQASSPDTNSLPPETAEAAPPPSEPVPAEPVLSPAPSIEKAGAKEILSGMNAAGSRENALAQVLSLWDQKSVITFDPFTKEIESDPYFFKIAAGQHNLEILPLKGETDLVKKLNLPAILGVTVPDRKGQGYLAVVGITTDNEYIVHTGNGDEKALLDQNELMPFLSGDNYIVWKNIFGTNGTISESSPVASIVAVKLLLRQIGIGAIDLTPVYDPSVRDAVKKFQAKHGLSEDGIIGPMTKIILLQEKEKTPCLTEYALSDPVKGS